MLEKIRRKKLIKQLKESKKEIKIIKKSLDHAINIYKLDRVEESNINNFSISIKEESELLNRYLYRPNIRNMKFKGTKFIIDYYNEESEAMGFVDVDNSVGKYDCEKFIDRLFESISLKRTTNRDLININAIVNGLNYKIILINKFSGNNWNFIMTKEINYDIIESYHFAEENSISKESLKEIINKSIVENKTIINIQRPEMFGYIFKKIINTIALDSSNNMYLVKEFTVSTSDNYYQSNNLIEINYTNSVEDNIKTYLTLEGIIIFLNPTNRDINIINEYKNDLENFIIINTKVKDLTNINLRECRFTNKCFKDNENEISIMWE